jgi:hypothetical protein
MVRSRIQDVAIGKFDILATYTYAKALLEGLPEDDAKERGMVAAIMGAQMRLGAKTVHGQADRYQAEKERAEKKKKSTITAASFDHQVAAKMGEFFPEVFLPVMKQLVQAGLSYAQVKRAVDIPSQWGAKIGGQQFQERATMAIKSRAATGRSPRESPQGALAPDQRANPH